VVARNKETRRKYLEKNKESIKKYNSEFYKKNKKRIDKTNRAYYQKNKVAILARLAINKKKNNAAYLAYGKARRLERRLKVISHYSNGKNECDCCKEKEMAFLTIDHINNDGQKHRKASKNNLYDYLITRKFPKGLRVLCFNCNSGRDKSPGKICPHELKRMSKGRMRAK
tara:strand:+ start:25432 stop:25941 length:510 start_codon:yes stop_codon:yes gene_type:complete